MFCQTGISTNFLAILGVWSTLASDRQRTNISVQSRGILAEMSLVELLQSTQDLARCRSWSLTSLMTWHHDDKCDDDEIVCFYMLRSFLEFLVFAIELLTSLNLCRYCPVRCTVTCGGGTPYQQFLVSQRRYTVYLQCSKYHKNVKLHHARCTAQAQDAPKLVFGRGWRFVEGHSEQSVYVGWWMCDPPCGSGGVPV